MRPNNKPGIDIERVSIDQMHAVVYKNENRTKCIMNAVLALRTDHHKHHDEMTIVTRHSIIKLLI